MVSWHQKSALSWLKSGLEAFLDAGIAAGSLAAFLGVVFFGVVFFVAGLNAASF